MLGGLNDWPAASAGGCCCSPSCVRRQVSAATVRGLRQALAEVLDKTSAYRFVMLNALAKSDCRTPPPGAASASAGLSCGAVFSRCALCSVISVHSRQHGLTTPSHDLLLLQQLPTVHPVPHLQRLQPRPALSHQTGHPRSPGYLPPWCLQLSRPQRCWVAEGPAGCCLPPLAPLPRLRLLPAGAHLLCLAHPPGCRPHCLAHPPGQTLQR